MRIIYILKLFTISMLSIIFLNSCDCEDEIVTDDAQTDDIEIPSAVQFQVLAGSLIEGLSVCLDNNVCKKTDTNGMVEFEELGDFTFKIKDMDITTLQIDTNKTIISPYSWFDTNETLAREVFLLIHTFNKNLDLSSASISLTFSSYIPEASTIETFINDNNVDNILNYTINDHNITVDFNNTQITRDGIDYTLDIPAKIAYENLNKITSFIEIAEDKNVTFDSFDTRYILKKNTLTSFSLGSSYEIRAFAREDEVIVEIYDYNLRTTDEAVLVSHDDNQTLLTNLMELTIVNP